MNNQPCLVVIAGPTAIGKTSVTINLAKDFQSEIISADSRQIFKELIIGSAMPSEQELNTVPHHFIGALSITDRFNVADYEKAVIEKLDSLFKKSKLVFMTGGSGLYINAVCNGLDKLPEVDEELRKSLNDRLSTEGLESLAKELAVKDPESTETIDLKNPQRVIRALELVIQTGKKLSEVKTGNTKKREFTIVKILLDMDRDELYKKINFRVDGMMAAGLLKEAESLFPHRHLNALQTVGYKELFEYLEGKISLERAVELIKQNTRRYAKRQLTWFRNDIGYKVFHPDEQAEIKKYIKSCCGI